MKIFVSMLGQAKFRNYECTIWEGEEGEGRVKGGGVEGEGERLN